MWSTFFGIRLLQPCTLVLLALIVVCSGDQDDSLVDILTSQRESEGQVQGVWDGFYGGSEDLGDAPDCDRHGNRYAPLACWLYNLNVFLPDEKIKKGIFHLSVHDLVCTQFVVGKVNSSYNASHSSNTSQNPMIDLEATGISATCNGKYKSTGMSGSFRATVQNRNDEQTRLSMVFNSSVWKDSMRMATSVSTQDCAASLGVPHNGLKFSGSISAKFINLFSGKIASYVSSALATELCPLIRTHLDPLLTKLIQKADNFTKKLVPNSQTYGNEVETAVSRRTSSSGRLVDFARDVPLMLSLLDMANHFVDEFLDKGLVLHILDYFGYEDHGEDVCGYFFRGLNGLAHTLTHGTGTIQFGIPSILHQLRNLTFVIPKYGQLNVVIKKIHVSGIDRITNVNAHHRENQTFVSSLDSIEGMNVTADVNLTVSPVDGGMFKGDPLRELFAIHLNASAVSLVADLFLAIEEEGFNLVDVADILLAVHDARRHNFTQLGCLLEPLKFLRISDLLAQFDILGVSLFPDVRNGLLKRDPLELDLDNLLNTFMRLFVTEYDVLVKTAATGWLSGPGRAYINKFIDHLLEKVPGRKDSKTSCVHPATNDTDTPNYFDFRTAGVMDKLNRFLSREGTLDAMNKYTNCVADYINEQVVPAWLGFGCGEFAIKNIAFKNVGRVKELDFLKPEDDGHSLFNRLEFGTCDINPRSSADNSCARPKVSFTLDVSYPAMNVTGQANVTAAIGDVVLTGAAMLKYDMSAFGSLAVSQLLTRAQCAAVPAALLNAQNFSSTIGYIDLNLSSIIAGSTFDPIRLDFDSDTNQSISNAVASVLSWSLVSAEDLINGLSNVLLPKAPYLCNDETVPSNPDQEADDGERSVLLKWNLIFVGLSILVAQSAIFPVRRWKESNSDAIQGGALSEPLLPGTERCESDDSNHSNSPDEGDDEECSISLMFSALAPEWVRYAIPIVTVGTISILLSSNLSTGASVDLQVSLPDSGNFELPAIFAFSLANTIRDFYNAGIWALLLLVLVFSGIWPYVKLLLMLFGWSVPARILSTTRRERLLLSLDSLGKFSLVDTYVLVLMLVAFRFHLDIAENTSFDVFVTPGLGFYGFLLATCSSLVIGHIILFFHRRSSTGSIPAAGPKEALCAHEFEDRRTGELKKMSLSTKSFVVAAIVVTSILLGFGATRKCFHFKFGGLTGIILGDDSLRSYSMLSLGSCIRGSVKNPTDFGILSIQIAYFFYAIIMPFTCLMLLMLLLCCPLSLGTQQKFLAMTEIANAWSAVEVFAISIVAALLEISTFADFIIGHKCDFINQVIAEHFHDQMGGEDKCYTVHASVGASSWILLLGTTLNSFVVSLLLRFLHRAMAERIDRESDDSGKDFLANNRDTKYTIIDLLLQSCLATFLFTSNYNYDTVEDNEDEAVSGTSSKFWENWRKVVSWT